MTRETLGIALEKNVYPMIAAGAAHYELLLNPEENKGEIKTGDLL